MARNPFGDENLFNEKFLSAIKDEDWSGGPKEEFRCKNFGDYLKLNWELMATDDYGKEKSEMDSRDVLDFLPFDPFGMDISARFTTFTWIKEDDFELSNFGIGMDETEKKTTGDDRLLTGINLFWEGTMRIYPRVGDGKSICSPKNKVVVDANVEELRSFRYDRLWAPGDEAKEVQECTSGCSDCCDEGGAPPDALFYALSHLGVKDLLSVERVCKSLCDAVRNDPLLWRRIHIDQPLSYRITDDSILQLTSRAKGSLKSLSLVNCFKITDSAMDCVLQSNPGLTELSLPGCLKLSADGIISNLKALKAAGLPGIKHLRIGGSFDVTKKHFEELKCILAGDDNHVQQLSTKKPRFYQGGELYLSFDDDLAIDIEECPKCQQFRRVYDCPTESCRSKNRACRGCICCISRCFTCGCCLDDRDYEERFAFDLHCLDCFKQLLNCQERREETRVGSSSIFQQQEINYFCLSG